MFSLYKKMYSKTTIVKSIILLTLYFFVVQTGILLAQISGDNVSISVIPEQPGPYEEIGLILSSETDDLSRSEIKWFLNKDLRLEGVGEIGARFTTGPAGSVSQISIEITTPQGDVLTRNISIRPSGVDILWNAFSYTPPFYKGKALAPSSGLIIFTAIPQLADREGNLYNPKDLVYTWSRRGVVLGNSSGVGKQRIALTHESVPLQPFLLTVVVNPFRGGGKVENTISVPVTDTLIRLYEKHPLEGASLSRALLNDYVLQDEEVTLRAEPFYFSLDDLLNNLLRFRWRINNKDINTPLTDQNKEVTFGKEGNSNDLTRISIEIENDNLPFRVLQSAKASLNLYLHD